MNQKNQANHYHTHEHYHYYICPHFQQYSNILNDQINHQESYSLKKQFINSNGGRGFKQQDESDRQTLQESFKKNTLDISCSKSNFFNTPSQKNEGKNKQERNRSITQLLQPKMRYSTQESPLIHQEIKQKKQSSVIMQYKKQIQNYKKQIERLKSIQEQCKYLRQKCLDHYERCSKTN